MLHPGSDMGSTELRESMRTVMKQLVRCAVIPSPIRRNVDLAQLERCQAMLYQCMLTARAESKTSIHVKQGMGKQNSLSKEMRINSLREKSWVGFLHGEY